MLLQLQLVVLLLKIISVNICSKDLRREYKSSFTFVQLSQRYSSKQLQAMFEEVILCLFLVLVPAELAKPTPGCVTIQNLHTGEFLTHSYKKHDNDRRHVSLYGAAEQWVLIESGDHYRLRHRDLNEELYESEQNYNGNYIFTWIPKNSVFAGEWDIWESRPGYFYIQNVQFRHCLSSVFWKGWVGAYPDCSQNGKIEWQVHSVKC